MERFRPRTTPWEFSRRQLLQRTSLGGLGLTLPTLLQGESQRESAGPKGRAAAMKTKVNLMPPQRFGGGVASGVTSGIAIGTASGTSSGMARN